MRGNVRGHDQNGVQVKGDTRGRRGVKVAAVNRVERPPKKTDAARA